MHFWIRLENNYLYRPKLKKFTLYFIETKYMKSLLIYHERMDRETLVSIVTYAAAILLLGAIAAYHFYLSRP